MDDEDVLLTLQCPICKAVIEHLRSQWRLRRQWYCPECKVRLEVKKDG